VASPTVAAVCRRHRQGGRAHRAARDRSGGHTQRLLTVVKSGSIQDVKAQAGQDKVHVWPHLLIAEFVAALFILPSRRSSRSS
jgi:hypothetical protein